MLRNLPLRAPAACAALVACAAAGAQDYPSKAVRVIVPFATGGGSDITARNMSQKLTGELNQQFIVENRPGAGGIVGLETLIKSPPDGYTIMISTSSWSTAAALYKPAFDPTNDITPVVEIGFNPLVLSLHPSVPAKTPKELIALAKARPNQIDFASSGNGSTQHLTGALFIKMAGIQMTHVPYRGSGPATADLLAGQVTVGFPGIAGMLQFIKTGKLRALGVSGGRRSAELADVPTIAEAGVPGYEMVSWFGMAGPKGISRDVQTRLHGDLLRVLKNTDFQKSMQAAGQEVAFQDAPEKFYDFMKVEAVKWARVVADSGARVE